jgi:RimJ/RimL family protein N-acetyltransferase
MIVSDQLVAEFIGKELGFGVFPPWTAMGIEKEGAIIGGVLFNCFEGSDLHVTVAGRGFGKNFLQNVGDYVYNQLGCTRMTIQTEKDSIVGIATRMGGKVEGRLRDHFGKGRDAIIIGILRDEYRYLQKED